MSEEVRNALRPSVDVSVCDFVDASIAVKQGLTAADISAIKTDLRILVNRIQKIEEDVSKLSLSNQDKAIAYTDDKYALTKQKLVRLMVDMGYMK
jgi:hypothetical protein